MSRSIGLSPALQAYLIANNPPEPDILARLRAETVAETELPQMQISWEQAALMQLLVRLTGARRQLEIGVFTGYSSLATALALPADGQIVACDVSAEWTAIARRYWQEAGVAGKITLELRPALETLDALIENGESGRFDLCFIDADKGNYDSYYERALTLLRPGGLMLIDNTLWSGRVAEPDDQSDDTVAIRALNAKIAKDDRVIRALTTVGDGLTITLKL